MTKGRNFTKEEVEAAYRQIPSFKDNAIDSTDIEKVFKIVGFTPTPEQIAQYIVFWNACFDGKAPMDVMVDALANQNDAAQCMKACITGCDKNKDGFIDEEEFKVVVGMILTHDPDFPKVDFTRFAEEADTNKDGKVSIEEAVEWFAKAK